MSFESYIIAQMIFGMLYGLIMAKIIKVVAEKVFWDNILEVKKIELENRLETLEDVLKNE